MNPYVYSKRGRGKTAPAAAETPSLAGLAKYLLNAPISTAMAFAVVVFAAGSVMAMTAPAYEEIAMGDVSFSPMHVAKASFGQVLGETTSVVIDDQALEALEPVGQISAKPGSYDASTGRWSYTIKYKVSNLNSGATLSIGTYAVKSAITESGSVETGAILKPGKEYRLTLWVGDGTGKQIIARAGIKTQKAKNSETDNKTMTICKLNDNDSESGNSGGAQTTQDKPVMCVITKEGKAICPQPAECQSLPKGGQQNGQMPPPAFRGMPQPNSSGQGTMQSQEPMMQP